MIHSCRSNTQRPRVCVCVATEDEGSDDEDDEGLRDAEKGDDDEPATFGKTVRPSFVRGRLQLLRSRKLHALLSTAFLGTVHIIMSRPHRWRH